VAGPNSLTTLAPLFYVLKYGGISTRSEFLYPLGHFYRNVEDERVNLVPLVRHRQELSGGPTETQVFPFFWGRTAGGETYGGVFPLAGTFKQRYNRDSIFFLLWPLYSSSSGEGSYHYHFLWPFFSYSTGRESARTFWPFAGEIVESDTVTRFSAITTSIRATMTNGTPPGL
jgi:hypothetical protein